MADKAFQATRIADRVYWVGAIDWALRDFHGYFTGRGTTYNAYLVVADKITLIDTVKRPFLDEMLSRIASVVDPARIDYVISNHAEMDHSGCLPELCALAKPEKLFASKLGVAALEAHFPLPMPVEAVANGASMTLGSARFEFQETRMLHWPESMFTWLPEDKVLFSQDAFGMHLASQERFTDELPAEIVEQEFARYFANILTPLADLIPKLLAKLSDTVRQATILATDHGPLWRQGLPEVVKRYERWSAQQPTRKIVIAYDTMWQSTALMAKAIAEGAAAAGGQVALLRLGQTHRSDIAAEILEAGALLVGSPTLNGQMFPTVADVLTYLKGLKPKNLVGGAFGSFGWSPGVGDQIAGMLKEMKIEPVAEPLMVKFVPREEDLVRCRALGEATARRVLAK